MNNNYFKNISFVGRIAYGIMCAENYLMHKYSDKNWGLVFELFWKVTKLDLWDEWMDEILEIIPEFIFEFDNYEDSDFEYLSEDMYNKIVKLYYKTDEDVNVILKMVYKLASSHAYSSIQGDGEESLEKLNDIVEFLVKNGIELPDYTIVEKYKFSDNNGWGNSFDGSYLSKTL